VACGGGSRGEEAGGVAAEECEEPIIGDRGRWQMKRKDVTLLRCVQRALEKGGFMRRCGGSLFEALHLQMCDGKDHVLRVLFSGKHV
jgi:hypothetical protein